VAALYRAGGNAWKEVEKRGKRWPDVHGADMRSLIVVASHMRPRKDERRGKSWGVRELRKLCRLHLGHG